MGLDYDSTVMLTCKQLFAAAKAIVDVGPDMPQQSLAGYVCWTFFLFRTKGGHRPPMPPPVSATVWYRIGSRSDSIACIALSKTVNGQVRIAHTLRKAAYLVTRFMAAKLSMNTL